MAVNNCGRNFLNCLLAQGDGRLNPQNFIPKALTVTSNILTAPATGGGGAATAPATQMGNGTFNGVFESFIVRDGVFPAGPQGADNLGWRVGDAFRLCTDPACDPLALGFAFIDLQVMEIGDDGVSADPNVGAATVLQIGAAEGWDTIVDPALTPIQSTENIVGTGSFAARNDGAGNFSELIVSPSLFEKISIVSKNGGFGLGIVLDALGDLGGLPPPGGL